MASGGFMRSLPLLLLACSVSLCSSAIAAPTYQQAMADYAAGKYALALGEFQALNLSYPKYALGHYYMAMCQQALGRFTQAKSEYKWVVDSRDAGLAAKAAQGLSQLSSARGTGSSGSSVTATVTSTATQSAPVATQKLAMGKVKKVLEFWSET